MGIDPKPFDPKTFVEEDAFVTDESGNTKRIRLENNIVRYRAVRKPDGTISVSRFSVNRICSHFLVPILPLISSVYQCLYGSTFFYLF